MLSLLTKKVNKMSGTKKNFASFAILIIGIALVVAGIVRTEHKTVLTKAVNICLECIGIG